MSAFTVRIRDFRAIEELEWSPSGVCVLTGANGAGKSTTLSALRFLRTFFEFGPEAGLLAVDGAAFRRLGAEAEAAVEFSVEVQDLVWQLRIPISTQGGFHRAYGEELRRAGELVLRAGIFESDWQFGDETQPRDEKRCCFKVLWDRDVAPWLRPLVQVLENIRIYESYWLNQIKRPEQINLGDSFLHHTGRNLWSVLANWKGSALRYRGQFDWVLTQARRAFPGLLGQIEFDRGLPYLFSPDATDAADGLLPNRAADGLLTGLLHLTAVAGAKNGSLVAFDEVENQLHPHAIRSILAAMRQQADERDLTILLTTHSPVVLNQFRDEPEQVYVLGHRDPVLKSPASMADLHSEEWLAQSKLGTLYERLAFGAPDIPGELG